jgi:hypothetical protein
MVRPRQQPKPLDIQGLTHLIKYADLRVLSVEDKTFLLNLLNQTASVLTPQERLEIVNVIMGEDIMAKTRLVTLLRDRFCSKNE